MIKVFIPEPKIKINKPNVRGLWLNNQGRLFYDYLKVIEYYSIPSYKHLQNLKIKYKQEAIFYTDDYKGYIYSDKKEVFSQKVESRYYLRHKGKGLKALIKDYLKCYGGVTFYITKDYIDLQAFYNPKEV